MIVQYGNTLFPMTHSVTIMYYIKQLYISAIILLLFVTFCKSENVDTVEVITSLGKIKGSIMKSRLNRTIYYFRGVRYAEPPVDEYRFQPPYPVKPWTDVFDASKEGPSCPRPNIADISEDCLRLNIYVTELPSQVKDVKRPVIVFFHPGGFYTYSAQSSTFGPKYLMDKNVVLVTVNYRLASLGYLSTGDSLIPGNMGMKDQVIALRWIRDNIVKFGGDPNSVTISGYSAGSWSVILHMLSPMSQGLFHKVIASSGAPTLQDPTPKNQVHLVVKQAEILNCPTTNLTEAVQCMKTKTTQQFADSLKKFFEFYGDPILVWRPVIEPEVPGVERFLTDYPENLIREGKIAKVPIITGVTKDEFGGVVTYLLAQAEQRNYTIFNQFNEDWYRIAPISFLYERNTTKSHFISDKLKEFYLNNKNLSVSNLKGLAELYADAVIIFSEHRFVNLINSVHSLPVYFYNFVYQGRYSTVYYANTTKPYGVVHHDDLYYVFSNPKFRSFTSSDPEIITVERMTTIYEHFAKTGIPLPENDDLFDKVTWERYTDQNKTYLEIGNNFTLKNNLKKENMEFWDSLFPVKPLSL